MAELTNEMLNIMFDSFNKLQNAQDYQFLKKKNYYEGKMDILNNYNILQGKRSNEIIISNYIQKFVAEEASYVASNPISFTSTSEEKEQINTLYKYVKGFSQNTYLELLKQVGIFGEAYKLLYYIQDKVTGEYLLKSKIYNPLNSFIVVNDFDEVEYFFYIYSKNYFSDDKYIQLYDKDYIRTYKVSEQDTKTIKNPNYNLYLFEKIEEKENLFQEVPVSICKIDKTVFDKIKSLNDNLNMTLSNNINISNDVRSSFLCIKGAKLDEEGKKLINQQGILYIPPEGDASFLTRDVNSDFALNLIKTCIDQIYQQSNHLNQNEKNTSNTSGANIRSRLIGLEQRCSEISNALIDSIKNEIRLIFNWDRLINNTAYNYLDVNIKTTINVPFDLQVLGDFISKVGDKFSLKTLYAQCPFIDNPQLEFDKMLEEKRIINKLDSEDMINLDNISEESDIPQNDDTERKIPLSDESEVDENE